MGGGGAEVVAPAVVVTAFVVLCVCVAGVLYRKRLRPMTLYVTIDEKNPDAIRAASALTSAGEAVDERQLLARARLFLRSRPSITFHKLHQDMGFRKDKHFFSVKDARNDGYTLMIFVPKGPNYQYPLGNDSVRKTLFMIVTSLKHTFLCPLTEIDYIREKDTAVIFRPYSKQGSIRDFMHNANPIDAFSKKYIKGTPLPSDRVAIFGRQIIEALIFLKMKGINTSFLHCGNILVKGNHIMLTDYELDFLGYPPNHIVVQMSRVIGIRVDVSVISFGCVLYEMVTGSPPDAANYKDLYVPATVNANVMEIIEGILLPSTKARFRALSDIAAHPFFASAPQPVAAVDESAPYNSVMLELLQTGDPGVVAQRKRPERQRTASRGSVFSPVASPATQEGVELTQH